jgi:hypothetical protein
MNYSVLPSFLLLGASPSDLIIKKCYANKKKKKTVLSTVQRLANLQISV